MTEFYSFFIISWRFLFFYIIRMHLFERKEKSSRVENCYSYKDPIIHCRRNKISSSGGITATMGGNAFVG